MSTSYPSGHERQIDDVLRQVNRYWRGGGVPKLERRDRLEELRDHLQDASTAGRDVNEVVGSDVAAFAADWIQADRPRPWLTIALRAVAVLALTTGASALLGPVVLDQGSFALTGPALIVIVVVVLAVIAADITRKYRAQISTRTAALLGIAGVVVAGVAGGFTTYLIGDQIVADPSWPAGVTLLAVGAICAETSRRMHRTGRTAAT